MSKLRTHIVIHESFLLDFISKNVTRLVEAVALRFMKNASASGFSKKSNASEFASASSFFLHSASASTSLIQNKYLKKFIFLRLLKIQFKFTFHLHCLSSFSRPAGSKFWKIIIYFVKDIV